MQRYFCVLILYLFFFPILSGCSEIDAEGSDNGNSVSIDSDGDIELSEGDEVTLTADIELEDSDYILEWTQDFGPEVEFSSTTGSSATITLPFVQEDDTVSLRITARRGENRLAEDTVNIRISNRHNGPEGLSPQGIRDDNEDRRNSARNNRDSRLIAGDIEVQTYDGTFNNLGNEDWGSSFSHLQRMDPTNNNDYADGISSMAGPERASPRLISNLVHAQEDGETIPNSFSGSDFVWQWGQFIDHDLSVTDGTEEEALIEVPTGDRYFDPRRTGRQAISFSRALFDHDTGTSTNNPREQENELTSWIDGSMVYGSSSDRAEALRLTGTPLLKTSDGNLLPFNTDDLVNANGFVTDTASLFVGGDIRVNEQVGLTVMHTLFVREHNRLARIIRQDYNNPTDDEIEEIFQRARRVLIAKIQKITYDEWLPALLRNEMDDYMGEYEGYDDDINPTIYNEFSVAAFRLGHSMLNQEIRRIDEQGNEIDDGHLSLADAFFTAPDILTEETSIDPILRGLASQAHQRLDVKVIHDVRNFLFGAPGDGGLDLVSLNIQRGRDHGVLSYNDMREAMNLGRMNSFADITSDEELQEALELAYTNVNEIDLWVGGLAEDPDGGSQLGELFSSMIAKQFAELRDGDRFWYERIDDFSEEDEQEIQGSSLAQIIRDNSSIGDELQDNVFSVSN